MERTVQTANIRGQVSRSDGMKVFTGTGMSAGLALAPAFILEKPALPVDTAPGIPAMETDRLKEAVRMAEEQLQAVLRQARERFARRDAAVFEAQLLMLHDQLFAEEIAARIAEGMNAAAAVQKAGYALAERFFAMDNDYFREWAEDVLDVAYRLCCCLTGTEMTEPEQPDGPAVIIARQLAPSDIAMLDPAGISGIITEADNHAGHSAVLIRALGIPAVGGVKDIVKTAVNGEAVLVDGNAGTVILNPDETARLRWQSAMEDRQRVREELAGLKHLPAVTLDGKQVDTAANLSSLQELSAAVESGADGIGLFRTEFLGLDSSGFPDEEEQFEAYCRILKAMAGRRTVIRTMDAGADKPLPGMASAAEANPALGLRGLRFSLQEEELFRTQLRALLRASVYGQLAVMFPMVTTVGEFRRAKQILLEEKEKLQKAGIPVSETVETGLMIEVPAAAVMADVLAAEADFFSIGTNDLIQYTLASDRLNTRVAGLYGALEPAVLRLIRMTVEAAHAKGCRCAVCGEMAADAEGMMLLVGLGADELSVSPHDLLRIRKQVRSISAAEMQKLAEQACRAGSSEEVHELLSGYRDNSCII
ncbi:MAG: phosphoenolpyruvate--protein phosphotransferase [Solobacterium sp.]|nr:phosphoenolpyruvate--protein phosphotransferase [Solobacterium sp.]